MATETDMKGVKVIDKNKLEAIKLQYQTLMAEYQSMRQSVSDNRSMQGQLDNIALAALGISIPIILTVLDQAAEFLGVILLIPILFFAVTFTQMRHERMLMVAALYIDGELKPRIEEILAKISSEKLLVLQWEGYLSRNSWYRGLFFEWISVCLHSIIGFGAGIGIIGIYAFIRLSYSGKIYPFEIWLLVINGILFFYDLFAALTIARQRRAYNKNKFSQKI